MTKERLEELIKQRATIWYDGHFEIKLNPKQYSITEAFGETVLWYQPKDEPSGYDWSWELDVLREDVDRAKWEHDMYAERTERFKPPMLQDIKDKYIYTFVNGFTEYTFSVIKNKKHYCIGVIEYSLFDGSHNHLIDIEKATKENYEKACEMVRDLFMGKK